MLPSTGSAVFTEKDAYLDQLIARAREQKTWLRREWQSLLHYNPELIGKGVSSLIDDADFFLSRQGKSSPQAELEASLKSLFLEHHDDNQAIACRFPARLAWLTEALDIKEGVLPDYQCTHLNNWLNNMDADGLTLIFPVSVLNSPASMFGHTFLRFDRKHEKRPDLLAWTANYAAYAEEDRGLSFAFNGLFGGYKGKFSLAPYHTRVKAYSDIENRDMWEYQLNYSPAEIKILLQHLWELLPNHFDYFFIDENCAYQLLALLDVAKPELALAQSFRFDATPAETVRALVNTPGLLKAVNYRPSLRQLISSRSEKLSTTEREIAHNIALAKITPHDKSFVYREPLSQAAILELATEYIAYLNSSDPGKTASQPLLHSLLTARSKINVISQQPDVEVPHFRPDQGHRDHRIAFRYGYDNPDPFLQFDFRWVYHDLYDPSSGFTEGAQLTFLQPAIRYYPEQDRTQLESIDFVSIISTPIQNDFIKPYSWEASAALKRYRFNEDSRPLMADFKMGMGSSHTVTKHTTLSFFANTTLNISDQFEHNSALAIGGRIALITDLTDSWRVGLNSQLKQYIEGIKQTAYSVGIKQRFTLNRDSAVVLDIEERQEFGESYFSTQLSWQLYF